MRLMSKASRPVRVSRRGNRTRPKASSRLVGKDGRICTLSEFALDSDAGKNRSVDFSAAYAHHLQSNLPYVIQQRILFGPQRIARPHGPSCVRVVSPAKGRPIPCWLKCRHPVQVDFAQQCTKAESERTRAVRHELLPCISAISKTLAQNNARDEPALCAAPRPQGTKPQKVRKPVRIKQARQRPIDGHFTDPEGRDRPCNGPGYFREARQKTVWSRQACPTCQLQRLGRAKMIDAAFHPRRQSGSPQD